VTPKKEILRRGDTIKVDVAGQKEIARVDSLINRGKTLVVKLLNGWRMKVRIR